MIQNQSMIQNQAEGNDTNIVQTSSIEKMKKGNNIVLEIKRYAAIWNKKTIKQCTLGPASYPG